MKIKFVFLLGITLLFIWTLNSGADPLVIPAARFASAELLNGVPAGWSLDKKAGKPLMRMKKEDNVLYLNLISPGDSAFGIRKEFRIDVKKFPILCWRWKANKLPCGGDIRKPSTDDQALQLYVAFKAIRFPAIANTPVIGYIWDTEAPKGWSGRSPHVGGDKLRYIVLRNRTDQTGQWYTERRNLYKDYKKLFGDIKGGEPQGLTTGLQIHINSQRTKSPADSLIGEIYFSADPADIALAESAREVKQTPDAKISAVKPPPPPRISAVKKQTSGDCLNVSIKFDPDSATFDNRYSNEIKSLVAYLIRNPDAKLTIIGHTDSTGTNRSRMILSKKRAMSVKNYLVDNFKIDPQRLNIKGAGSVQPVADNNTEEGRRDNNRVAVNACP
ncbi:MAG: DUF3047 domain-containing protein [Deltaproteobacteria bacterium]|nr:DUF3047 domain-containing protein [Deltaproteobacteria bacterium]